ncbi:UNVERIFIED_CONTAM: hypothetical protein Sindi_2656600 [Sesamum indicum]
MAAGDEEEDEDTPASDGEVGKVGGRRRMTGDGEKNGKPRQNFEEEDDLQSTGDFPAKDATITLFETVALNPNAEECELGFLKKKMAEEDEGFSEIQSSATGVYPRSDAIDSFGRVPRPQLEQQNGNLVGDGTGTKLGFGAAIETNYVEAAILENRSQRESENSPSAMNAEDLGTGNVNETVCSPENSRGKNLGQASMADGVQQPRFNFFEFLTLAHKVVNSGDAAAMAALSDLKQKWELQYGRPARIPAKTPRHVQPNVRRVVRCLLDDPTVSKQPLNNRNAAAEFSDSAAENTDFSAALCAGNQPANELGMAQKSQQQYTELLGGNTMEKQQFGTAAESENAAEISDFSAAFLAGKHADDELEMVQKSQQKSNALLGELSMEIQQKMPSVSAIMASKMLMKTTSMGGNSVENSRNTKVSNSHSGIFIGNIPLHTSSDNYIDEDKIARAFNNSSRKTLTYIAPLKQNGEIVVRPSLDIVREGSKRWKSTAVGYFLGKRPYYHHLKEFAHSVWPALREVTATVNGFFFFRFKTVIDMEEVIEGGPWLFQGQPIVLQKWEPGMAMRKLKHTQVPVWIKLRHLPMEFWTTEGLSTVASGVGKPLYPDAITRACTRLDFARVCVMIDVTQKIEKHIIIMTPDEDGGETPCKVDVEYEWLPAKCTDCMTLGHSVKDCIVNKPRKPTKPPIAVYVQKATIPPQPNAPEKESSTLNRTAKETPRREEKDVHDERNVSQHSDKGKEVVIYNAFDALHMLDDAEEPTRGPNISSPVRSDPC